MWIMTPSEARLSDQSLIQSVPKHLQSLEVQVSHKSLVVTLCGTHNTEDPVIFIPGKSSFLWLQAPLSSFHRNKQGAIFNTVSGYLDTSMGASPSVREIPLIGCSAKRIRACEEKLKKKGKEPGARCCRMALFGTFSAVYPHFLPQILAIKYRFSITNSYISKSGMKMSGKC